MEKEYTGIIIMESLTDDRVLSDLEFLDFKVTKEDNPVDRWHMFKVKVSLEDIEKLSNIIKNKWYMHFWKGRDIIAIFKGKQFKFNFDNKETWKDAVEYGKSIGIPEEQLDFPINSW